MPVVNKKVFSVINRVSKTFSVFINDFDFATTLLVVINIIFSIGSPLRIVQNIQTQLRLRKIRISIPIVKLTARITQAIRLRKIRLAINFKERGKITTSLRLRKIILGLVLKAREKWTVSVRLRKVRFVFTEIVATFFTLGYFDPDTLGTWDASTLGDMDYT